MKRGLFFTMMILVIFIFTSLAFAKGKPPKTVCWQLSGPGYYDGGAIVLNFKKSGIKTKTSSGVTKFYHVQGAIGISVQMDDPISGTAYYDIEDIPNTTEASLTGGPANDPVYCRVWIDAEGANFLDCKRQSEAAVTSYTVMEIDCRQTTIE